MSIHQFDRLSLAYPTLANAVLEQERKNGFPFSSDYTMYLWLDQQLVELKEALGIRDSRIAELTELVLAVEDDCGETRVNMVGGEFWFEKRDKLLP